MKQRGDLLATRHGEVMGRIEKLENNEFHAKMITGESVKV